MTGTPSVYPTDWMKDIIKAINDAQHGINAGVQEQINKYGEQRISALAWIAVIAEEFGEMVAEYNKQNLEEFEKEAFQTIACVTRLIHEVRREHNGKAEAEGALYERHS